MSDRAPAPRPPPSTTDHLVGRMGPPLLRGTWRGAKDWARDRDRDPMEPGWLLAAASSLLAGLGLTALALKRRSPFILLLGGAASALAAVFGVAGAAVASTRPPPPLPQPDNPWADPLFPFHKRTGLHPWGHALWVAQQPLSFTGVEIGARMAVVRTPDGLLLYSPIEATAALVDAVRILGDVRWIVAPNPVHHLFVSGWAEAFPEAEVWGAPDLAARRPDLDLTGTLDDAGQAPWAGPDFDTVLIRGNPAHIEIALLHRPSATVLIADWMGHLGHAPETPPLTRAGMRLAGLAGGPSAMTELKLMVTDRAALRRSAHHLLSWPAERVFLTHGRLVESGARAALRAAFRFAWPGGRVPG